MSGNLYLTSGISCSGKSKFANYIKEALQAKEVNADNIRAEFGDISDQSNNEKVFKRVDEDIVKYLAGGYSVILSNTNLHYFSMVNYAKKFPYNKIIVFLMEDSLKPELCKERIHEDIKNGVNRSKVPDEIIDKQFEKFYYLLDDIKEKEHPSNLIFFVVDSNFAIKGL